MPNKGEKVNSNPIIEYLDADIESRGARSGVGGEPELGGKLKQNLNTLKMLFVKNYRKLRKDLI